MRFNKLRLRELSATLWDLCVLWNPLLAIFLLSQLPQHRIGVLISSNGRTQIPTSTKYNEHTGESGMRCASSSPVPWLAKISFGNAALRRRSTAMEESAVRATFQRRSSLQRVGNHVVTPRPLGSSKFVSIGRMKCQTLCGKPVLKGGIVGNRRPRRSVRRRSKDSRESQTPDHWCSNPLPVLQ
mmetsp:Transcript_3288/g.6993  ORF Transcript_3288/g.6993 Transcript_3288/m.6993 type:complete len:184 (+) Transcript_3288:317-868(+)